MRRALAVGLWFVLAAGCKVESSAPGSAPVVTSRGPEWHLQIYMHYVPCPNDGRSCLSIWEVGADGEIRAEVPPEATGATVTRMITLSTAKRDALRALIDSPAFQGGMRDGFPCQQTGDDVSASWTFRFEDGAGKRTSQRVEACFTGPPTLPSDILALLRT